jgi:hypothetical protein
MRCRPIHTKREEKYRAYNGFKMSLLPWCSDSSEGCKGVCNVLISDSSTCAKEPDIATNGGILDPLTRASGLPSNSFKVSLLLPQAIGQ